MLASTDSAARPVVKATDGGLGHFWRKMRVSETDSPVCKLRRRHCGFEHNLILGSIGCAFNERAASRKIQNSFMRGRTEIDAYPARPALSFLLLTKSTPTLIIHHNWQRIRTTEAICTSKMRGRRRQYRRLADGTVDTPATSLGLALIP